MAESQGFEPWVPVKVQRFSRPSRSTAPATLRMVSSTFISKEICQDQSTLSAQDPAFDLRMVIEALIQ